MAHPDTTEKKRLLAASAVIADATSGLNNYAEAKLTLLEYVSCSYSGISITDYFRVTGYTPAFEPANETVSKLRVEIDACGIAYPVALSALARIDLDELETKKKGSVYTDFRLAAYLAQTVMPGYSGGAILDPSCGSSILLAACADYLRQAGADASSFVSSSLFGVDLEPLAIRGSILALASLLCDSACLSVLISHFVCADSLERGAGLLAAFGVKGFALVVGNPPWERVRPSRSEFARAQGVDARYGESIEKMPEGYEGHRDESRAKSRSIANAYGLKGGIDLYQAFLALSVELCSRGGTIALYLPAGLIRSKGLADAREMIADSFGRVGISIFMNRAKFFSIDSRFKFVLAVLAGNDEGNSRRSIEYLYCDADDVGVGTVSTLELGRDFFCDSSRELGAPEVRTAEEAALLRRAWGQSDRMAEHELFSSVAPVRELDMTLDRSLFQKKAEPGSGLMPLIEGRMVSPYRCGCKQYVSGEGRSAKWKVVPPGSSRIKPQFYVSKDDTSSSLRERTSKARVGYCDIAGQTNERAMQAALIPAECVCGNKVPTLLFNDMDVAFLWLGIANSFVFDWLVRRYITTTINFFILENLPFPRIDLKDTTGSQIVDAVRELIELKDGDAGWSNEENWQCACLRGEIDALVLRAYGLGPSDFELIVNDFPLVDRVNAAFSRGHRPTFDLIRHYLSGECEYLERAREAWAHGALPYMPNEHLRQLTRAEGKEV